MESSSVLVDSVVHPLAVEIRQLLDRSSRKTAGRIIIDDEENILQALAAGVAIAALFRSVDLELSEALRRRLPARTPVHQVAKRTGMKLFETAKMSRVFAVATSPRVLGLDAFAHGSRDLVVLEDVAILGNAGAIVRSSLAFGAGGLVLLNVDPVDVYDRRLIRASRGLVFSLPIATATTGELLEFSSRLELPVAVTAADATTPLHALHAVSHRLAIVFGSETRGCSQALVDAATLRVKIPIDPIVDSLNVSAAAGITLYNRLWFNRPDLWSEREQ